MSTISSRLAATGAAMFLLTGGLTAASSLSAAAATCSPGVRGDVNGDGHADVAVSEAGYVGKDRGAVHLFYGRAQGLTANASGSALDDQYVDQSTAGVPGTSENNDRFGAATAFGDFNHDGCADLVAGVPGENGGTGSVTVLYGGKSGLTTTGAQSFALGALFAVTDTSGFGDALAVGDLNDDGIDDLAVGAPDYSAGGADQGGAVVVLYGGPDHLHSGGTTADLLTRNTPGVPGDAAGGDFFGAGLAAGDFNKNGHDELAVGFGLSSGGGVQTLERGTAGYGNSQPQPITEASLGIPGSSPEDDEFGAVLAAGDVDADGHADLAVGLPAFRCLECDEFYGSGAVVVLKGSTGGVTGDDRRVWTQASPGVAGAAEDEDAFGFALAMGRFDAGPTDDLAIGTPQDQTGTTQGGSVTLLLGGPSGLTTEGRGGSLITQDTSGIVGKAEDGDYFGAALTAAYVQDDSIASLVVGAPDESVGSVRRTGQLHQLSASETGPTGSKSTTLHLDSPGVKGKPSTDAGFGGTLN